ncbi:hypothetical protein VOI54_03925 [Tamlana sp. 2201CG12-4]|uniref:hypothetical protein n=1 Tax=Tamlana sp. 2201CG12-4 TaxID=3112582 RepID=UPI002DBD50DC|nr:hypothetical protein [Tamlana sp. 2201CG12-4]MEC3906152.1 hypothetical protein [Tamlana sp. 2201CG12-4]
MIRNYTRELSGHDKKILAKEIAFVKKTYHKTIKSIFLKLLIWLAFGLLIYYVPSLWLIIPIGIITFFMIWMFTLEIKDLISFPKFLKKKSLVIDSGIVRVQEINIDRYIKINNYNDEGNHFIVEFNGMLSLIGGQEFLGVRKLKNKIEHIMIMDSENKRSYHDRIKKSGNSIDAYYIFKNGLSDNIFNSKIWDDLTNREPFYGKLEDFNDYIAEDKN